MRKNLSTSLERALPIVASAYGEQFGVNVLIGGTQALTDGRSITLPLVKSPDIHDVLFGYLAHESGHIRSSDFRLMGRLTNPLERFILNAIEDVRIEEEMISLFPGTKITIDALYQYVFDESLIQVIKAEDNPATQLVLYILYKSKVAFRGLTLFDPLLRFADPIVRQTYGDLFVQEVDQILTTDVPNMTCCDDAHRITTKILDLLKVDPAQSTDSSDDSSDSDTSDSSDDSSDSDTSDSSDDSSDSDTSDSPDDSSDSDTSDSLDDSSDSDTSDSSDDSSDSDTSDSSDDSTDSGTSDSTITDELGLSSVSDKSGSSLSASDRDEILSETELPLSVTDIFKDHISTSEVDTSHDGFKFDATSVGPDFRHGIDGSVFSTALLGSSRLRSRLTGLLQAHTREDSWLHHRGKRVSATRLARVSTGDQRVFLNRDVRKSVDTSVHLLIDASGSMRSRQSVANGASVTLSQAIQTISNCDIAVSVFPAQNACVSPVLSRKTPVRSCLERFSIFSGGTTPLAEAMLYAARELTQSPRHRKVLIIVTDGEPNCANSVAYINSLLEGHIDTYAIGINTDSVQKHFKNSTVINDVNELQDKLFELSKRYLITH